MNTKKILVTGLTIGAFLMVPAAFAAEGSQRGGHQVYRSGEGR